MNRNWDDVFDLLREIIEQFWMTTSLVEGGGMECIDDTVVGF